MIFMPFYLKLHLIFIALLTHKGQAAATLPDELPQAGPGSGGGPGEGPWAQDTGLSESILSPHPAPPFLSKSLSSPCCKDSLELSVKMGGL